MKKTLLLIFFANLFFAQNAELINTSWQVTKVVGEMFSDQLPPSMPYQQVTEFRANPSKLNLSFFNTVSADLTYTGENQFTVNNKACTLANYMDDNGEVNQFFGLLCSFFQPDSNYYYTITNNGSEKTLTIDNTIFQSIHFKSVTLGTKENELSKIMIAPNPSTDIITIENLRPNAFLQLIDNSGKIVKSISNNTASNTEINIKNLPSGVYYLKVDGKSVQKIIKK
ncbi:T9SS type A sorting domain-containing protein [Chryseobacterium sp. FH1]|uniref:T9SS type A sorting domain-containing protein n=1 Tax=Chryseobacterium sp. FH1 TaxID=1233951 RepID=UPI0004E41451|nr:T9SS type A sorting domain-containing protein [Chryseobacterium sp. FH1]KFC20031.1 hypothetical protein IO90_12535 [Chryseobacterium sp. FH1]